MSSVPRRWPWSYRWASKSLPMHGRPAKEAIVHTTFAAVAKKMSRRLIDGGIGMLAGLVAGAAGVAIRFGRDSASDTAASSSSSSTSSDLGVTTASSSNSTDLAAAAARFAPYGLPSHENLSLHEGYASSINYRLRIPNWVAEHLVAASAAAASDAVVVTRERSNFHEDVSVPAPWRSTNADYARSGWSRGHLAPAGAHKGSQHELDETFLLSANIVPQDMSSNGSDWLRLERFTRALLERHDDVYIISGPLFVPSPAADGTVAESAAAPQLPRPSPAATSSSSSSSSSKAPAVVRGRVSYEVIGPHEVAVPTHLFKVVLTDGGTDGRRRRSALHACAHHGAFPPPPFRYRWTSAVCLCGPECTRARPPGPRQLRRARGGGGAAEWAAILRNHTRSDTHTAALRPGAPLRPRRGAPRWPHTLQQEPWHTGERHGLRGTRARVAAAGRGECGERQPLW